MKKIDTPFFKTRLPILPTPPFLWEEKSDPPPFFFKNSPPPLYKGTGGSNIML